MNSKGCHGRYCISSTHPLRDATNALDCFDTYYLDFNPRTPYGMRPRHGNDYYMSILYFNPRTPYGMRQKRNVFRCIQENFNPRTPYGMRQKDIDSFSDSVIFQSTHPLRDATQSCRWLYAIYFNPRTPYGMRLSARSSSIA